MPKIFKSILIVPTLLLLALPLLLATEGALAAEKVEAKKFHISLELPDRWSNLGTRGGDNKWGSWWSTVLLDRKGVATVKLVAKSPIPGRRFRHWSFGMRRDLIRTFNSLLDNVRRDDKIDQFEVTLGPGRTATARVFIVNPEGYYDYRVIFIPFALYPDKEQDGPWYMLFIYNRGRVAEDIPRDVIKTILEGLKLYPPETAIGQK